MFRPGSLVPPSVVTFVGHTDMADHLTHELEICQLHGKMNSHSIARFRSKSFRGNILTTLELQWQCSTKVTDHLRLIWTVSRIEEGKCSILQECLDLWLRTHKKDDFSRNLKSYHYRNNNNLRSTIPKNALFFQQAHCLQMRCWRRCNKPSFVPDKLISTLAKCNVQLEDCNWGILSKMILNFDT